MSRINITLDQLEQTRYALHDKALQMLGEFRINAYPNNYTSLAQLINKGDPFGLIKDTWLRNFFTKPETSFSKERIDAICEFVFGTDASTHFGLGDSLCRKYNIYLKNFTASGYKFDKPSLTLSLWDDKCSMDPDDPKNDAYIGQAPEIINGNMYLELKNKKDTEKIYIIVHVGVAEDADMNYLGGLYLGINRGMIPSSGPLLLVSDRVNEEEIRYDLFQDLITGPDFSKIEGISIEKIGILLQKEHIELDKTNDLRSAFVGIYQTFNIENHSIIKGRMEIEATNLVTYESDRTKYEGGELKIVGVDRLIINIRSHDARSATLYGIFERFRCEHIEKLKYFVFGYASSGNKQPGTGIIILERMTGDRTPVIERFDVNTKDAGLPEELYDILLEGTHSDLPPIRDYFV